MNYTVWIKGYTITGNSEDEMCLGTIEAENFIEAARKLWQQQWRPAYIGDPHTSDDYFRVDENGIPMIWGCECFQK